MAFNKKQKGYLITLFIINIALVVFILLPVSDKHSPQQRRTSFLEEDPPEVQVSAPEKKQSRHAISREGDKIVIEYEPVAELSEEEQRAMLDSWRINVNEGTLEQLVTLPRIGPALAQRIIDYREEHGLFVTEADLQKVSGVGPAMLNHLRDLIHFGEIDPRLLQEREAETRTGKINLNLATEEDLLKIRGIGPVTAKRIIEYREENQRFNTVEDLLNVSGIGPATFERIKDQLTVTEAGMTRAAVRRLETAPQPQQKQESQQQTPPAARPADRPARPSGAVRDGVININRATADELTQLPRIGRATAERIIEHRNKIGRFNNIEQIKEVSGIGPALFENIKDRITVR